MIGRRGIRSCSHRWSTAHTDVVAQWSIAQFGTWGLIGLKFLSVILVVCVCEYIGRRNHVAGRRLACWSILASLLPVIAALVQVGYLLTLGDLEWTVLPATKQAMEQLPK